MIIFKHVNDISSYLFSSRENSKITGFVPTMGALHGGHISLIERAREVCDVVISSIFINPTQFNDPADFAKYPVTIEKDIDMLEKAGCDILFMPPVTEIYPRGLATQEHYELGFIETVLDGAYRPGHFQGVCRVVETLLRIINPSQLFLGQKDYQQCLVIEKLVELMDIKTQIIICPTQREPDGLAMSSRNQRLNEADRKKARLIYQTLHSLKQHIKPGDLSELKKNAFDRLTYNGFNVDYIEIADASTLATVEYWDGKTALVALTAAFINNVRLIDNVIL